MTHIALVATTHLYLQLSNLDDEQGVGGGLRGLFFVLFNSLFSCRMHSVIYTVEYNYKIRRTVKQSDLASSLQQRSKVVL